ncbi:hypothetical protein LJR029_004721 [Caballeronia sp. LjRoot29]|uniref:hypothetical protein n=1 Tax=Caballeronia sp. LjRoot29 TaxID=3342315 RepID=UPI003ED00834
MFTNQSEEEGAVNAWRVFQSAPAGALTNRSLIFRQLGASNLGGPCIVGGGRHYDALGLTGERNITTKLDYEHSTAVSALTVTPGGNGNTYWYPYIPGAVGECDVDYDVPVGTIALTAGMNGCSLRIYANPPAKTIKFCHDANGMYANDAAYARTGFQHLQSINADKRTRGEPEQNINDYWDPALFTHPASGLYFICRKTAAMEWTIFKSVVVNDGIDKVFNKRWDGRSADVWTYKFSGQQRTNGEVARVKIPSLAVLRPRAATI